MKKFKEYFEVLKKEYKERDKYEKENFKILNKFETVVLKILFALMILLLILNGIRYCKPPATLKADTYNSNINYVINQTTQMKAITYIETDAKIEFYGTSPEQFSSYIDIKIEINNTRAEQYRLLIGSSDLLEYVSYETSSNIDATQSSVAREGHVIGGAYIYGSGTIPTLFITKSNTSGWIKLRYQYNQAGGKTLYLSYSLVGYGSFGNEIQTKYANTLGEKYQAYIKENTQAELNAKYQEGYNKGLNDAKTSGGTISSIMKTIFDYPLNFMNQLLDFNIEGYWVGTLFYSIILLGLGFIVIKILF